MTVSGNPRKDLVVLVADKNMSAAVQALLRRHGSLGIRPLVSTIYSHAEHDPGCYLKSAEFLRPFVRQFDRALVMFDRHGCGSSSARSALEAEVEARLSVAGWDGRNAAVVIDPELEAWCWSPSPHVDRHLGWEGANPSLREWLVTKGFASSSTVKPTDPKSALHAALYESNTARSSSIFEALAEAVGFNTCQDPAFMKFRDVVGGWFPGAPQ